jgi:hypothetical protein
VPTTLSVSFTTVWSGNGCTREVGLAVRATVTLGVPLELSRSGESYEGDVVIDRFEPSGCGWQFGGIGYNTENPSSVGDLMARYDGPGHGQESYELDIWCINLPKKNPEKPEKCESLTYLFTGPKVISPEFFASVPEEERNNAGPVPIGPKTQSILVRFHDLDAIPNFHSRR